jgi:hypothetical protein
MCLKADPGGRVVSGLLLRSVDCGITCSNPADGMNVRLLCLLCVVKVAASATG